MFTEVAVLVAVMLYAIVPTMSYSRLLMCLRLQACCSHALLMCTRHALLMFTHVGLQHLLQLPTVTHVAAYTFTSCVREGGDC